MGAVDTPVGSKLALRGRVVTMDDGFTVVKDGTVCIDQGTIAAVVKGKAKLPTGFEAVKPVETGGTIFPGLIELHNHLSYNALRLWQVPKRYTNRDQWGSGGNPDYRRIISGPMKVLGTAPDLLPAVVRYVECKCLLGGVTTSQGVQLFSNAGARRYYRGVVRNVEQTDDPDLPEAAAKIADIDAKDAKRFLARLGQKKCFLLHLSEGTDDAAHKHFLALKIRKDKWAIADSLAGIHCAALTAKDFKILAKHGGSMIWSPLSNLLLYGATADVKAARSAGVRIGLGSDWAPSGSKNLLGELKVARLVNAATKAGFKDRDLVGMATREPARILKWDAVLGSIEKGKRADLIIVAGVADDAYASLLEADERDLHLVMINGIPRFGLPELMKKLEAGKGEARAVGKEKRLLDLKQESADPVVGAISLAKAEKTVKGALKRLPELAKKLEKNPPTLSIPGTGAGPVGWFLALDELAPTGLELRPRIGNTGPSLGAPATAAPPLSEVLEPLELDPLTAADDPDFLDTIDKETNLPDYLAPGLRKLYKG